MTDIDDIHHPIGFRNAHDGRRDPGDELHPRPAGLRDAVDRWGPDPGLWPDAAMAQRARAALLSDRAFRAYRDDAVVLDERLEVAAAALDSRIEAGPLARIRAGVMALGKAARRGRGGRPCRRCARRRLQPLPPAGG